MKIINWRIISIPDGEKNDRNFVFLTWGNGLQHDMTLSKVDLEEAIALLQEIYNIFDDESEKAK